MSKAAIFLGLVGPALLLLALGLTSASWLTLVLWPGRVERARQLLTQRWSSAVLRGALLLVAGLFGLQAAQHLGRPIIALAVLMLWAVSLLIGLPGLFEQIGERLLEQAERGWDRLRTIALGAFVVTGVGLLPWLGQAFWIFLALAAAGAGLSVLGRGGPAVSK